MSFRNASGGFSDLVYYSFVTLTTVGYGDITPVTPLVRALTCLEAIAGQFYLAVLIARLVGLPSSIPNPTSATKPDRRRSERYKPKGLLPLQSEFFSQQWVQFFGW